MKVQRRHRAIVAGSILAALWLVPATADAGVRVTATGPAPVVAPAGAPIAVAAKATGTGTLGLVLATSAKGARGGIALGGLGAKARGRFRGSVRGTVPASVPVGATRFLLVCAGAQAAVAGKRVSCRSAGRLPTSAPAFDARLTAAVAARRLSPGKAALYAFYAINGDPRLPLELRAKTTGAIGAETLVKNAARDFSTFPKAIRRELVRYFLPPAAKQSAWNRGTRRIVKASAAAQDCTGYDALETSPYVDKTPWIGVPTSDGKAVFWFQDGPGSDSARAEARSYARAMPEIWRKLTAEFGEPLSDANEPCFHGRDGRFDIYINDTITMLAGGGFGSRNLAITLPYPKGSVFCTNRPAWIAIKHDQPLWVLAHEFMHALQFAHTYASCKPPISWWDEGGATWAADFVYPDDDYEKTRFGGWVTDPLGHSAFADADYDAYPFWMMLHRTQGTGVLRAIFDQLKTKGSVAAVDAAVPGGLARQWPRFALQVFNQKPVGTADFEIAESYALWDAWPVTPSIPGAQALALDGAKEKTMDLPIENPKGTAPLSIAAYHDVAVTDDKIRELRFTNALKGSKPAHVDAMLRMADGSWKLQDWTQRDVTLCRDIPAENVQELVIVSTNAGPTQSMPAFTHKLRGRDTCGTPAFRIVGYSSVLHESTPGPIPYGSSTTTDTLQGPGDIVLYPAQSGCANDLSNFGPCGGVELTATVTTNASSTDFGVPDEQLCPGGSFSYQRTLTNPGWASLWLNPYETTSTPEIRESTPFLAVGDIESDHCGAVTEARPAGQITATGNRDALLAGTPVTFQVTGGGTEPPILGTKSITWTLEKTVTIQRVNPDGTAYTP